MPRTIDYERVKEYGTDSIYDDTYCAEEEEKKKEMDAKFVQQLAEEFAQEYVETFGETLDGVKVDVEGNAEGNAEDAEENEGHNEETDEPELTREEYQTWERNRRARVRARHERLKTTKTKSVEKCVEVANAKSEPIAKPVAKLEPVAKPVAKPEPVKVVQPAKQPVEQAKCQQVVQEKVVSQHKFQSLENDMLEYIQLWLKNHPKSKVSLKLARKRGMHLHQQYDICKNELNQELNNPQPVQPVQVTQPSWPPKREDADANADVGESDESFANSMLKTRNFQLVVSKEEKRTTALTDEQLREKFNNRNKRKAMRAEKPTQEKQTQEKPRQDLHQTRICKSTLNGKKCLYKNCYFAHSMEELNRQPCRYLDTGCYHVREIRPGVYDNVSNGKTCSFWHKDEKDISWISRMGLPKKVLIPRKEVKVQVHRVAPKMNPWKVA